jgi:inositol 1,4,5-triphosphate receptor type 1
MYAYSIFVHVYFSEAFKVLGSDDIIRAREGNSSETECDSLVHCFYSIINKAFRNGEGVGPLMLSESYNPENYRLFYARLFLEITFFLFVNVVLLNIIFGIIIDTFAELRTAQQKFGKEIK